MWVANDFLEGELRQNPQKAPTLILREELNFPKEGLRVSFAAFPSLSILFSDFFPPAKSESELDVRPDKEEKLNLHRRAAALPPLGSLPPPIPSLRPPQCDIQ